jgi:formylglycine-generating enzyme required for sulfatase activity
MKWGKIVLVIFGALVITALGIDAADTLTGKGGTLLSQVIKSDTRCPKGMLPIDTIPGVSCIDQYEVSTSELCPNIDPRNMLESYKNVETKDCKAESAKGRLPWSFVTRDQAAQLCARGSKRLPTSAEWYALSMGMVDVESSCNVKSGTLKTSGSEPECVSPEGAFDLVGNVWEWVNDDVIDGVYNNRTLPTNGYVTQIDNRGIAVQTAPSENELYGGDYFWSSQSGAFGIVRGGYYDSDGDAGIFSVHADTAPNAASAGIGFRCIQ